MQRSILPKTDKRHITKTGRRLFRLTLRSYLSELINGAYLSQRTITPSFNLLYTGVSGRFVLNIAHLCLTFTATYRRLRVSVRLFSGMRIEQMQNQPYDYLANAARPLSS